MVYSVTMECYGCSLTTKIPLHYEGDPATPWCSECFVTEEQLKEMTRAMPSFQMVKKKPRVMNVLIAKMASVTLQAQRN